MTNRTTSSCTVIRGPRSDSRPSFSGGSGPGYGRGGRTSRVRVGTGELDVGAFKCEVVIVLELLGVCTDGSSWGLGEVSGYTRVTSSVRFGKAKYFGSRELQMFDWSYGLRYGSFY